MVELERVAAEEQRSAVGGEGATDTQELQARGRDTHDVARAGQGVEAVEVPPFAPDVAVRAVSDMCGDGGADVLVAGAARKGERFGSMQQMREDLVAEFGGEGEERGRLGQGLRVKARGKCCCAGAGGFGGEEGCGRRSGDGC